MKKKLKLTSSRIIIFGFLALILLGTFLLMLPFSSREGVVTPFMDTLFTATSAVCVTGLVVRDTATYWSYFGQFIILLLIQTGGMGVITVALFFIRVSGKRISLLQRSTMQEAVSAQDLGGILKFTGFIVKAVLLIELAGALCMAPVFCRDFGLRGLWMALFHSISAFCNAGFDLMGSAGAFSSLTSYAYDPVINITVMLLIISGGIGFLTWEDIRTYRLKFRRYRLQSKVILSTTAILLIVPAVYFFIFEFGGFSFGDRMLLAAFQSVTTRTAGFNTADLSLLSEAGKYITIALMLIGGSTGSTAGGMKTNTAAVLFFTAISAFRRDDYIHVFGRRIDDGVAKNAAAILLMYLSLFFTGGLIISIYEGLPMLTCLFETGSAMGTVGLTLGITPTLGMLSRIVLIILMFLGRVGGLTLIFAALSVPQRKYSKFPLEKYMVG